jgi:hypothetical protein
MIRTKTERGFNLIEFQDSYGEKCSLQKSSSAMEPKIWLGITDPQPKIPVKAMDPDYEGVGWIKYLIPKEVMITGRMHLTISQVKELIPLLQKFVDTGEL